MSGPSAFESVLDNIRRVVRRFGRFRKRWNVLDGFATFVIACPGALLVWFGLDWALKLPAWLLLPLFVAVCGLAVWGCARWLLKPQLGRLDPEREALVIESLHGGLDNSLIGSLQLGDHLRAAKGGRVNYAPDLIRELVRRTGEVLADIRTKKLIDLSKPRWRLLGALSVAMVVASCLVFAEEPVRERGRRLSDAYAAFMELLFPVNLVVDPGDLAVVRGRPVTLNVKVNGARRHDARIMITEVDPKGVPQEPFEEPVKLTQDKQGSFDMAKAENSFTYRFGYGRRVSDEYKVSVEDLPEVKAINYEVTPPPYTGHPMRLLTGRVARLKGLERTGVLVNFAASTELDPDLCRVEWQDGGQMDLDISGRFGSFSFVIDKRDRVFVHLTGYLGAGFEMAEPLSFEVYQERDKDPTIRILTRDTNVDMTAGTARALSLPFLARDDFGVKEVSLKVTVESKFELFGSGKREGAMLRNIDPPRNRVKDKFSGIFRDIQPLPVSGEQVTIQMKTLDNQPVQPGVGRSREIVIDLFASDPTIIFIEQGPVWGRDAGDQSGILDLLSSELVARSTLLGQKSIKMSGTEAPRDVGKQPIVATPGTSTSIAGHEDLIALYYEALTKAQ